MRGLLMVCAASLCLRVDAALPHEKPCSVPSYRWRPECVATAPLPVHNAAPHGPIDGIGFDAPMGNGMVLQRAPAMSAVYGTLTPTPGARCADVSVDVQVAKAGGEVYTVRATVNSGTCSQWKALLKPTPATATPHTVTATCTAGCNGSANLTGVVFGSVWSCSGQSNMALPLEYTMSRNASLAAISKGKYAGIRLFGISGNMNPDQPWTTLKDAVAAGTFMKYSSTCYYFGESLVDELGDAAPPIGLVHTAWGGSTIEQWLDNATIAQCANATLSAENGEWHMQRVLPFVDMTLEGWVWYQAENDMHGVFGNSKGEYGYACLMPKLVASWRALWSKTPGTTDPAAPFGLVTLAPSGTEGGADIGTMRWAQTASYGTLPNPAMPNTFVAQAYDLNEPFSNITCSGLGCCSYSYNETKCGRNAQNCEQYCKSTEDTNFYMGPIHPRVKKPVGQRLALLASRTTAFARPGILTGPTLSGCRIESGGSKMTLIFNSTLLGAESIVVQNHSPNASKLHVLADVAGGFCMQVGNGGADCLYQGTVGGGGADVDSSKLPWVAVDMVPGPLPNTISVDLGGTGGSISAIRYAWQGDACTELSPRTGPCPIAAFPLMSSMSALPANPFIARVTTEGRCECLAPQVCGES